MGTWKVCDYSAVDVLYGFRHIF